LHDAIQNVKITFEDRKALAAQSIGVLMKIGYAFLWQEYLVNIPFLYNHSITRHFGALFMLDWNRMSSDISGFPQTDDAVITSIDLYPGVEYCRSYSPHALWHEESANGLLEIVFLCDNVNKILGRNKY
jgi:hypothetical protein